MAQFTAATQASARAIRDALPRFTVLAGDISVSASTVLADCPGLAVGLDAYSRYTIEGYIAFTTGVDPEIKFGMSAPTGGAGGGGATGTWSLLGIPDGTNANVGPLIAVRREEFNVGSAVTSEAGIGGSGGPMAVPLIGRIRTYRFGGALQLRFAQLYSFPSTTTINAGSWLEVKKIGSTL